MTEKIPVILDGDPGHDDAIAWMLAKSSPLCPWTLGAFIGGVISGPGRPIATGASMPSRAQMRCAL